MSPRPAVAALLGVAPLAVLLLRPPELTFGGRLWRASIYGAYSGRDVQREELRAVALSASTPEEQRWALGLASFCFLVLPFLDSVRRPQWATGGLALGIVVRHNIGMIEIEGEKTQ